MSDRRWLLLIASLCLTACASAPVEPWERGRLASLEMQWEPDPLKSAMREHTRFSKEGSSGRLGNAGGGCGCN